MPCLPCPIGRERQTCARGDEGTCVPCAAGFNKDVVGRWNTACVANSACPAGKYRLAPMAMAHDPGDCIDCPAHTYKDSAGAWDDACVACPDCGPGVYRDGCGGATAGTCTACPSGLAKTESHSYLCSHCVACSAGPVSISRDEIKLGRAARGRAARGRAACERTLTEHS